MSTPARPVPPTLVFIDTEATSLRADRRAWEVALVVRQPGLDDACHRWFVDADDLDLGEADPASLRIGGFYERHPQARSQLGIYNARGLSNGEETAGERFVLARVERLTRGALLVGAVPDFDAYLLAERMRFHGLTPSWHYHLVDVETLAAGKLGQAPPWGFDDLLATFGLTYDEADRHTALGDARMVRDLYDLVLGNPPAREHETGVRGKQVSP